MSIPVLPTDLAAPSTIEAEIVPSQGQAGDRSGEQASSGSATPPTRRPTSPRLEYDPEAIAAAYAGRWFTLLRRAIAVVGPMLIFACKLWWDSQTGQTKARESQRAQDLRQLLTQLGPAFIKVGQALSTRPDLVPPVYLEELTQLQDQLPPFENAIAYQFIEEELGLPPSALFAELSPQPIAAASLGQVYKGRLKTGEVVAIKVQRPGLIEQITLDVYLMRRLAKWAKTNVKRLRSDLVAITDEFAARIFEEMDYTQEGHNAERFQDLYGGLPEIYVPKIYWDYTGRRVITMEWITGTKLTQLAAIAAQGIDASHLIEVGVQCSLRQLLEHGFFHADPHPGNLLAMADGRLAYLDFGMMSQVKDYQRYGLIEAVVHMVNRDFPRLAEDYVKLEFLTPETDLAPIAQALSGVFSDVLGSSVAELNFKSITDQLSAVMYEYPFRVPAYYALIIRSLVTLEGIAIGVDPDFKVLSKAYPYIAKRLLVDPAPELRASLQDLLFREGTFRWNRLENLLRNARDSQGYDLNDGLDRAAEFLLSDRGAFIRDQIARLLVEAIDQAGQSAWRTLVDTWGVNTWGSRLGWPGAGLPGVAASRSATPATPGRSVAPVAPTTPGPRPGPTTGASPGSVPDEESPLDRLRRVWSLLEDSPGFDRFQFVQLLAKILVQPQTQQLGQQVASELAQRAIARFIREILLSDAAATVGHGTPLATTIGRSAGQTSHTTMARSIPTPDPLTTAAWR